MRLAGLVGRFHLGLVLILGLALQLTIVSPVSATGPGFVQSASATTTSTSITATFSSPVTTGDTIVVAVAGFGSSGGILPTSVGDTAHNTYVEAVRFPGSVSESAIGIWYAANAQVANNQQFGATFASPGGTIAIAIQEYSGLGSAVTAYQVAAASGTSLTATTCQPIETNQNSEVLFAATTVDGTTTLSGLSPATGYTLREQQLSTSSTAQAIVTQDDGTGSGLSPGIYPTSLGFTPSSTWHLVAAGFGASVSPSPTNTPIPTATTSVIPGCTSNVTPTVTPSVTPTGSATATVTPTATVTATATATAITPSATPTVTSTDTATATATAGTPIPPVRLFLPAVFNGGAVSGW